MNGTVLPSSSIVITAATAPGGRPSVAATGGTGSNVRAAAGAASSIMESATVAVGRRASKSNGHAVASGMLPPRWILLVVAALVQACNAEPQVNAPAAAKPTASTPSAPQLAA